MLSHEATQPIGRLVRDRDRFRFEADLSDRDAGADSAGRIASIAAIAPASSTGSPTDAITPSGR